MVQANGNIQAILLDIEGTTTPIAFVHEVLFTYAREHVRAYLEQHAASHELRDDIAKLRADHAIDVEKGRNPPVLPAQDFNVDQGLSPAAIDAYVTYVNWSIDRDLKPEGLKSLQGKLWQQGYDEGSLKSPLFPDVLPALERWRTAGLSVNIFSSGSTLAQKLLFANTDLGDVTNLISNYFDTKVGKKKEAESYRSIAKTLGVGAYEVLFLSDVVAELDAASAAGMKTRLCVRPGNPPQESTAHQIIHTFDEV